MKTKDVKKIEAETRQAEYNLLSPAEKLARLDKVFGKGKGAKKERIKLNLLIKQPEIAAAKKGAK